MPSLEEGDNMLFFLELILAIIIVAARYFLNNKEKYLIKIRKDVLKSIAAILAVLLTIIILLQELIQQVLYTISEQEKD